MKTKSSAYYQRLYRQRLREQGLVKKEVWVLPEYANVLGQVEQQLRQADFSGVLTEMEEGMSTLSQNWTASSLFSALSSASLFAQKRAEIELLEGADPILHIVMHDYGELPLFLAISGDQIVIEGILWEQEEVKDVNHFNDVVLRTHKLFPLSSIALETPRDRPSYYVMYGALNAKSDLESILLEIEILADNIIKATEAYENHLIDAGN